MNKIKRPDMESFKNAAEPLMKWLADNGDPHMVAIIRNDHAELFSGELSYPTQKFIKD